MEPRHSVRPLSLQPVIPFEPVHINAIPAGDSWIAQIKWDGVRILLYKEASTTRLFNRKRNERTLQYPELTHSELFCHAHSVILDGEVIALDQGKPSFAQVMKRDALRKEQTILRVCGQVPIIYMVFDILYCNGNWVTDQPLAHRQQLLQQIIASYPHVLLTESFPDAHKLYDVVLDHQLEGMVCKDLNSTYLIDGKDSRWRKKKLLQDTIAVIGGVTHRNRQVNAIILGQYDQHKQLQYIGHAGTGKLTQNDWRDLTARTNPLIIPQHPFASLPSRHRDAMWIQPILTVKLQFLEWTSNRTLRQPSIQAVLYN